MRYRLVIAHAFGGFRQRELQFVPGLNVITGPNEAGKSTWHAALYAGLCGTARRRGQPRKDGTEYLARYRPWNGPEWEVAVEVDLADGRTIELRHDLVGKVACRASDTVTGRDCSSEIVDDGAPNGAAWLGLDRRTFLATACIRQAQITEVCRHAGALQEYLQRAATSHNVDTTAAEALQRIGRFHEVHVGVNRANAVKPLRKAMEWEQAAEAAHLEARTALRELLALEEQLARLEAQVARAELDLRTVQAARAIRQVERERGHLRRAEDLAAGFPDGRPPSLRTDSDLADEVAAAIDGWERRPAARPPVGPTAAEIRAALAALPTAPPVARASVDEVAGAIDAWLNRPEPAQLTGPNLPALRATLAALPAVGIADRAIDDEVAAAIDAWEHRPSPLLPTGPNAATIQSAIDALPAAPVGDESVAPEIQAAYDAAVEARRAMELHERNRPDAVPLPETGGATPDELRELARELETPPPGIDPGLRAEYEQAAAVRHAGVSVPIVVGTVALLLLGAGLFLAGQPLLGVLPALLGLATGAAALMRRGQGVSETAQLAALAARIEAQQQAVAAAAARLDAARHRIQALGLPAEPAALRGLAETRATAEAVNRDLDRWTEQRIQHQARLDQALAALDSLLVQSGLLTDGDPVAAYRRYADDCQARAEQARKAARRPELERQLELRLAADAVAAEVLQRRTGAERRLREVAANCRIPAADSDDDESIVAALRGWQQQRQRDAATIDAQRTALARQIAEREAAEDAAAQVARARSAAEHRLRDAAAHCGVAGESDEDRLGGLRTWQAEWESHAAGYARRPELEQQLAIREEADAAAAAVARQREEAAQRVTAVADRCGIGRAAAADLVPRLREWQAQRAAAIDRQEQALPAWGELESILAGRTLQEYKAVVSALWESAQQIAEPLDEVAVRTAMESPDLDALLELFQADLDAARAARATAAGQAEERARTLPSVAGAEEELAAARAERARVERLDRVLSKTQDFLRQAEDQVHRDIAPVLASSIRRRLGSVTNGRYHDVRVDPQSLDVKVAGASGHFRLASDLSHGTAEQIYLLLRVALAEWLTKPGESCPLILDDVTVQSDTQRTVGILETLRTLGEERQVILFSQEEDVLQWAEARQADGVHLIRLDAGIIPA